MLKNNIKGVTLLEAFLAAFLFVTSVAAIFVTMNNLRKPAVNNERMLEGAMILRDYLEDLRSKVDYREYSAANGAFRNGIHPNSAEAPITRTGATSNITFTITYTVSTEASGAKNVFATVTWPDTLN